MNKLFLPALLLLAGCTCPKHMGLDGQFEFEICADPAAPLARGSRFEILATPRDQPTGDGVEPTTVVAWTTTDATVASVVQDEGSWLTAHAAGEAEIGAERSDGLVDRLLWEVADPSSARWRDPLSAHVAGLVNEQPGQIVGDSNPSDPGDTVYLQAGAAVDLSVELSDGQGRVLQATADAVEIDGAEQPTDLGWAHVSAPTTLVIHDDAGAVLATHPVEVADLTGATLELGAWLQERDGIEPTADDTDATLAWLRAVVRTASGEPVPGADVRWSALGPGRAVRWSEYDGAVAVRPDLAYWQLGRAGFGRIADAEGCLVARLNTPDGTLAASLWLTPDGGEAYDDETCGGQGCSCSTASDGTSQLGLGGLALLLLGFRRRR